MSAGSQVGDVAVVIPARNEADRIAATVTAAPGWPASASSWSSTTAPGRTGATARRAGAVVMRHAVNRGKAAAMQTGADAVSLVDQREGRERPRHLLFLDADLAESAAQAGPLADPVVAGTADMTIAVFATTVKLGGHGLVVGLSGAGIRRAVGWRPVQPLNGQRCLTRSAFEAARPLAHGWGVETALTIDLLRRDSGSPRSRSSSPTGPPGPACAPSSTVRISSPTWPGRSPPGYDQTAGAAGPRGPPGPRGPEPPEPQDSSPSGPAWRSRSPSRWPGPRSWNRCCRVVQGRPRGRLACTCRPTSRSA